MDSFENASVIPATKMKGTLESAWTQVHAMVHATREQGTCPLLWLVVEVVLCPCDLPVAKQVEPHHVTSYREWDSIGGRGGRGGGCTGNDYVAVQASTSLSGKATARTERSVRSLER